MALHGGLTVSLIATPRLELEDCCPNQTVAAALSPGREKFDYLPVVRGDSRDGNIVGLLPVREFDFGEPNEGPVRNHMRGITEKFLIGADASILDFLQGLPTSPVRLTVSGKGIDGLVSWADLQKLPVRAALFGLITGFELAMLEAIKRRYGKSDAWDGSSEPRSTHDGQKENHGTSSKRQ